MQCFFKVLLFYGKILNNIMDYQSFLDSPLDHLNLILKHIQKFPIWVLVNNLNTYGVCFTFFKHVTLNSEDIGSLWRTSMWILFAFSLFNPHSLTLPLIYVVFSITLTFVTCERYLIHILFFLLLLPVPVLRYCKEYYVYEFFKQIYSYLFIYSFFFHLL